MYYIFGFVLLLGILVFIHEFGHFITAKACGIRVETFSIGMGNKILKFTRGETEYALSLIPLGGYVKMTGQDPRETVPPELAHRAFHSKPLYQRAAVVLAGPFFNAALAILILTMLYAKGVNSPAAVLARILPGSPAAQAGFLAGDVVTQVEKPDGEVIPVLDSNDLERAVGRNAGTPLSFTVQRSVPGQKMSGPPGAAFQTASIAYTPVKGMDRDSTIGVMEERGIIEGMERSAPGPVIAVLPDSWAAKQQIPGSFWVTELSLELPNGTQNKVEIRNFYNLSAAWSELVALGGDSAKLTIKGHPVDTVPYSEDPKKAPPKQSEQEPEEKSLRVAWIDKAAKPSEQLAAAGIASAELVVVDVKEKSPAQALGLKAGDRIVKLNDMDVPSFTWFRENLQKVAVAHGADSVVKLSWLRDGKLVESQVRPEVVSSSDPMTEVKKNQFQIGAAFLALPASPTVIVVKAKGLGDAFRLGFVRTERLTESMLSSFYHLAKGDISHKTLGGPLLIAKISGESLQQGFEPFMRMMAFISLNLFILNLLPFPVLDGGHLLLYCVEAIRRKPLNAKVIEVWTTTGFFLLMGLVAVVMFNDLSRMGLFRFFKS